jgi:hypothetical protein
MTGATVLVDWPNIGLLISATIKQPLDVRSTSMKYSTRSRVKIADAHARPNVSARDPAVRSYSSLDLGQHRLLAQTQFLSDLQRYMDRPMRPFFQEGERVVVEFGIGDPELGEVIAASHQCKIITVRLSKGIVGQGDMPLRWRSDKSMTCWLVAK